MSVALPPPAEHPTMYFIGVSTSVSSIMAVYDAWKPHLGIADTQLIGIDLPIGAHASDYRAVASFIRDDSGSRGALVTTHKLALYAACGDLFDEVTADAAALREVSCLTSASGSLGAHALDPLTSSLALEAILPDAAPREFLVMGAGGAALALVQHLLERPTVQVPRLVITDVDESKLRAAADLVDERGHADATYVLECLDAGSNHDALVATMGAGSVLVNATGMGKDRAGSPLSSAARFPAQAIVWDFNYRGDLTFLSQARTQQDDQRLQVEDGWTYFVHGWTRAITTVFDLDIPVRGERFDQLSAVARHAR